MERPRYPPCFLQKQSAPTHMKKMQTSDLAIEIRNWTLDGHAQTHFWPLRATKLCAILGALCLVLTVVVGVAAQRGAAPVVLVPICLVGGVGILFVGGLSKTVLARKAPLHCSACGQPMDYSEFNYPADSESLAPGKNYETMTIRELIDGENGRLYALYFDLRKRKHAAGRRATPGRGERDDSRLHAARLMQGTRTCRSCRRYIVTEQAVFRKLGRHRDDIEEAEQEARQDDASA